MFFTLCHSFHVPVPYTSPYLLEMKFWKTFPRFLLFFAVFLLFVCCMSKPPFKHNSFHLQNMILCVTVVYDHTLTYIYICPVQCKLPLNSLPYNMHKVVHIYLFGLEVLGCATGLMILLHVLCISQSNCKELSNEYRLKACMHRFFYRIYTNLLHVYSSSRPHFH